MMRALVWKSICFSIITAGMVAMVGCATRPAPTGAPTGGLEGTISDASTGEPVPGAQVTVAGQAGVFTLTMGPDGRYQVADLPAGAYLISVQATGYYANAVQVGVVGNVISSGNVALEPAVVAVVTATPTSVPPPTRTPIPTPTVPPSVTPSPVPTATPSPTPTRAPVAPRRASVEAQPTPTHAAPVLLEPRDGSVFVGPQRIAFRWEGACCLADDEYYVVSIPHPLGVEEGWVKNTEWLAPDYLYLLVPESRKLTWSVSVRRHTGEHPNGQWKGPTVSPLSQTWRLSWHPSGDTFTSPLPKPASPLPTPGP